MNFCPKCEFMLFTKINNTDKKLINYCKNCSWIGNYIRKSETDKICVYKKKYNNDFISNSINNNPYIIYDNTLPRINNIECINTTCISNIKSSSALKLILSYNGIVANDIINKTPKTNIKQICSNYITSKGIKDNIKHLIKISKDTCIIVFKNASLKKNSPLVLNKPDDFGDYSIETKAFKPVNNEIIFIKYNSAELKYMYVCSNCKTSWKN